MQITVKDRQSLLDISLIALGSISGIFALALRNAISVTTPLADGFAIRYEIEDVLSPSVRSAYELCGIEPATEMDPAEYMELLYLTGTPRPVDKRSSTSSREPVTDMLDKVIDALDRGDAITPQSPARFTRVFQNQFSEIFS